jgi:hypothetical protein
MSKFESAKVIFFRQCQKAKGNRQQATGNRGHAKSKNGRGIEKKNYFCASKQIEHFN